MKNTKPTTTELEEWKQRNAEINKIHQLTVGNNPTPEQMEKAAKLWAAYYARWGESPGAA